MFADGRGARRNSCGTMKHNRKGAEKRSSRDGTTRPPSPIAAMSRGMNIPVFLSQNQA